MFAGPAASRYTMGMFRIWLTALVLGLVGCAHQALSGSDLDRAMRPAFVSRIEAMSDSFKNPDVKTVSRLLSSPVVGPNGRTVASVHDILLSPVGEATYAILKVENAGGKLVAVPVASLAFTRGGQPLKTTMTAEQLGRRAPVRY